jgi:putative ABC transport system permease protein
MMHSLYIAWKYVSFYKARSLTLIACVTLIITLPLALEQLLDESERQLSSRAASTPLLLGVKGSALDLVMNSLYFDDEVPELISMAAVDEIEASGLATAIPLYVRFRARSFPIVGTTLDYFDFRGLEVDAGRQMALLGECVIGAEVAERLALQPGDTLLSSPETLFDLAGVYPLRMKVAGVLARSYTPDDHSVFVDIKTAWVVQGLVHGHQDLTQIDDASVVMSRNKSSLVANAKLVEYNEITTDNLDSFHFHGAAENYPLTGVLVLPDDERAGTLLRGRYLDADTPHQLAVPAEVIDGLLANIFRIKNVLDAVILLVGTATLIAMILIFALSLRLRQREIRTVFRIGGSRSTVVRLLTAEIAIILSLSLLVCLLALNLVGRYSDDLVRWMLIS